LGPKPTAVVESRRPTETYVDGNADILDSAAEENEIRRASRSAAGRPLIGHRAAIGRPRPRRRKEQAAIRGFTIEIYATALLSPTVVAMNAGRAELVACEADTVTALPPAGARDAGSIGL